MLIKINVDVYAYYEHFNPIYRIWINDTLYNEREFWVDCLSNYIEEEIHVDLEKGYHTLTCEKVNKDPRHKIWLEKVVITYENLEKIVQYECNPQDKQIINFEI